MSKDWIKGIDYPEWAGNDYISTLKGGYLQENETPKEAYIRLAETAYKHLKNLPILNIREKLFEIMWNGWLIPSSPVMANMGTDKGSVISCVTGDTWINTQLDGGKMASEIKIGDSVLTHKGRYRKVTNVMISQNTEPIYKLKVANRMTNLHLTGNHLVLTNLGWVRTDELSFDKHLIATNYKLSEENCYDSNYVIDMKEYCERYAPYIKDNKICKELSKKAKRKNNTDVSAGNSPVSEYVEIDNELAWAFGLWFAEGSLSTDKNKNPNGIRITLNTDEQEYAEKWIGIIENKFSLKGSLYKSEIIRNDKKNSWLSVNINSEIIGKLFESFGRGCKNKLIPEWILKSSKSILTSFLEGVLLGDGSISKNGNYHITLANPKLILQIYKIGLLLDFDMSLQMQSKAGMLASTSHVYTINFRNYKLSNSLSKTGSNIGVKFSDGLCYSPMKCLEKTEINTTVYDFTVEEDHSFSAAGVILHNCFSSALDDSISSIWEKAAEVAMMSKIGGGTSINVSKIRPIGSPIRGGKGGNSSGVLPFLKVFDATVTAAKQSDLRRGACAVYMDINHKEARSFMNINKPTSGENHCHNLFTGFVIDDKFMKSLPTDRENKTLFKDIIKTRIEKGFPYLTWYDNFNKTVPKWWNTDITIKSSNLC